MAPELYIAQAQRVRRMVRDLDLDPAALLICPVTHALKDGVTQRALTPPLHNQTVAEGLLGALKIAVLALDEGWFGNVRVTEAERAKR